MIKLENTEVVGWEAAIRGMRNPMNSWEKSDSIFSKHVSDNLGCWVDIYGNDLPPCCWSETVHEDNKTGLFYNIGHNDHDLMMRLAKKGSDEAKYRRMIVVYFDITAPVYFYHDFDTYKVATVSNSQGQTRQILDHPFSFDDFSHDKLSEKGMRQLMATISELNEDRDQYLKTKDRSDFYQIVQKIPKSHNQRRTMMVNYEVLHAMYFSRKNHIYDEWREFCQWIESLPYSEIITAKTEERVNIVGWRPISEYDCKNYDWVLVKCFDGYRECIPTVAEMRYDGLWYGEDGPLPFEPRYFFDMQQLDNRESEG